MADDARISTATPNHPKTKKLLRRLREAGVLALIYLWLWVADNRWDGDLSGMTVEDVEIAAGWNGEPGALVAALVEVGFLDGEDLRYRIHDWADHQPYVATRASRVQRARELANVRWEKERRARAMQPASDTHTEAMLTTLTTPHHTTLPTPKRTSVRNKRTESAIAAGLYELYPKKVGKADALKAITNAIERVRGARACGEAEAVAYLAERVRLYAASPAGNEGKFTPHPASWFNGERYLDDDREWRRDGGGGKPSTGGAFHDDGDDSKYTEGADYVFDNRHA